MGLFDAFDLEYNDLMKRLAADGVSVVTVRNTATGAQEDMLQRKAGAQNLQHPVPWGNSSPAAMQVIWGLAVIGIVGALRLNPAKYVNPQMQPRPVNPQPGLTPKSIGPKQP